MLIIKMGYQIDQSIKIENTQKASYVCLANGKVVITSISAKDKRVLKTYYRRIQRPLIFKLFTFSVLCAKVIFYSGINYVAIDEEYAGHEADIMSFITQVLIIWGRSEVNISFIRIGKNSTAHIYGYNAYKNGDKGIGVSAEEVLILYNRIDKP